MFLPMAIVKDLVVTTAVTTMKSVTVKRKLAKCLMKMMLLKTFLTFSVIYFVL